MDSKQQTPVSADDIDNMSDEEFANFNLPADEAGSDDGATADPSPPAEKEPEPRAQDDAKPEEGDDRPKSETVPHGQFHRERERRKAAEQQAEIATQRLTELLQASAAQREQPAAQQAQLQPDIPDQNEDPFGYMIAQTDRLTSRLEEIDTARKHDVEQQRAQANDARLWHASEADLSAYAAENPSAGAAYEFLAEEGRKHLRAQGVYNDQDISNSLARWQVQLAAHAENLGVRPSRLVMMMAQERGWQAGEAGKPAAPSSATEKYRAEAEKIAKQEQARNASLSLSGEGGEANTGMPTAQEIIDMSDEDYAKFKAKYGEEAARTGLE